MDLRGALAGLRSRLPGSHADTAGDDRDGATASDDDVPLLTRRRTLGLVGVGASLGAAKAADNVLVGYGVLVGTNLLEQDLAPLASAGLPPSRRYRTTVDGVEVELDPGTGVVRAGDDGVAIDADREAARAVDERLGLAAGPVEQLVTDVGALARGNVRFEFSDYGDFFDRLDTAGPDVRRFTAGALRGPRLGVPGPALVSEFAAADPAAPRALVEGLAAGFREHADYDVPRYAAGSVEDNLLFGSVDLRRSFESPTGFRALLSGENSGMFCYELANRAAGAFHAVPATDQRVPVFAGAVLDSRHKHVYTALASAVRDGDGLVVPVTVLDYTHVTLYADLGLRGVLGDGLDAYDARHRATAVYWYR